MLACGSGNVAVRKRAHEMEGNVCSYSVSELAQGSRQCRWMPRILIQPTDPGDVELVPLDVGEEMAAMRNGPAAETARPFFTALALARWALHAAPSKCPFSQGSVF